MKKTSLPFLPFLLSISYSLTSFAQRDTLLPYPAQNLVYPFVYVVVSKSLNQYAYGYSVTNGPNALQGIYRLMVEVRASITENLSPANWRPSNLNYDTIKVAKWASEDSTTDIGPNKTVAGFEIKSSGLPSVSKYWVRAWETVKGKEGQYDPSTANIFVTHLRGTTIGPADPPKPFVHLAFLDTVLSYKHQAVTLGWIVDRKEDKDEEDEEKGDGVVAKLDKRLSKARSAIIKGDSVKARDELKKFVKKVEDLFKKTEEHEKKQRKEKVTFTSEAYALLKFNAEYLIDRLPVKQKRGKGKDKSEQ